MMKRASLSSLLLGSLLLLASSVTFATTDANSASCRTALEIKAENKAVLSPSLELRLKMQVKTAKEMLISNTLHVVEVGQFLIQHAAAAVDKANNFLQTDSSLKRDFGSGWTGDELGEVNGRISSTFAELQTKIDDTKEKYGTVIRRSKASVLGSLIGQQKYDLRSAQSLISAVKLEIDELGILDSKFSQQQISINQEADYLVALQVALHEEAVNPTTPAHVAKAIHSNLIPATVAILENLRSLQGLMSSTRISLGRRASANLAAIDLARINNTAWSSLITTSGAKLAQVGLLNPESATVAKKEVDKESLEKAKVAQKEKEQRELISRAEFCIQRDLCTGDLGYIMVPVKGQKEMLISYGEVIGINEKGAFSFQLKDDNSVIKDLNRGDIAIGDKGAGYQGYQVGDNVFSRDTQAGIGRVIAVFPDRRAIVRFSYQIAPKEFQHVERVIAAKDLATGNFYSRTGLHENVLRKLPNGQHIKIKGIFFETGEALVRFKDQIRDSVIPLSEINPDLAQPE